MGSKRKANAPIRWRPGAEAELTAATTLGVSLLGGAHRRSGGTAPPVERNLLSGFKGDAKPQSKSDRAAPSLALSLRVGSEEEEEAPSRPANAAAVLGPGHGDSFHLSLVRRSRVPEQPAVQAAAPLPTRSSRPPSAPRRATPLPRASAGGAPAGSSSAGVGLHVAAAGATARYHNDCDMCSFYSGLLEAATAEVGALRATNVDLRGQVWSLRDELEREQRKKVGPLQRRAAPSAGAGSFMCRACGSLMCRACWCRPATVVALPNDEHICLCRRCSAASRGDPSIACPRCAAARAAGVVRTDAPC